MARQYVGARIAGAGSLLVSGYPGAVLGFVNVTKAVAATTLSVYDDVSAVAANLIAVLDTSVVFSYDFERVMQRGIFVVLAGGSPDINISYA